MVVERSPASGPKRLLALQRQADGDRVEVALLIASLRMADDMTGIEFFTQAHELASDSKRLLLITYGDPAARAWRAQAMALGQLETFVNKPWVSPEEGLYPAVSELLSERAKEHLPCFEMVRVVGGQWSPDTHLLRDLLERNPVSYGFYDSDSLTAQRLPAEFHLQAAQLPAAILHDARVLMNPSLLQMAAALGAHVHAQPHLHDVTVIGAAPAGLPQRSMGHQRGSTLSPRSQPSFCVRFLMRFLATARPRLGRICVFGAGSRFPG